MNSVFRRWQLVVSSLLAYNDTQDFIWSLLFPFYFLGVSLPDHNFSLMQNSVCDKTVYIRFIYGHIYTRMSFVDSHTLLSQNYLYLFIYMHTAFFYYSHTLTCLVCFVRVCLLNRLTTFFMNFVLIVFLIYFLSYVILTVTFIYASHAFI